MPRQPLRGSAPDRARDDYLRRGSFKHGHPKRGGRRPGAPNAFSADYKKAILEAMHRIGYDGNGSCGVVGYLMWTGVYHPRAFCFLLGHVLCLEGLETTKPPEPLPTVDQINERVLVLIGRESGDLKPEDRVHMHTEGAAEWTGQDFPLSTVMHAAIESPEYFCKLS